MKSLRAVWFPVAALAALAALHGVLKHMKKTEPDTPSYAVDRVYHGPPIPPQRIVNGRFDLGKSRRFSFIIPAHVIGPDLYGKLSSSARGARGGTFSDQPAEVEFVVLSESQYDDFMGRRSAESVYETVFFREEKVRIALPGTLEDPVRYYVVFLASTGRATPVSVNADLTVEFGSSMEE